MADGVPEQLALVRAFANTVDVEEGTDELSSVERFQQWLSARGRDEPVAPADLDLAWQLRTALRLELAAHDAEAFAHDGWQIPRRGEATAREGEKAAHDGEAFAHDGWQIPRRGEATAREGEKAAHDSEATAREGERAARGGERVAREGGGAAPKGQAAAPTSEWAARDGEGTMGGAEGRTHETPAGDETTAKSPDPRAELDRLAAGLPLRARFTADGVGLAPTAGGVPGLLAEIVAAMVLAERDGTWSRLKICREDTCRWAYYDRSKNSSKCWCGASCGNRNKTRAYRQRRVVGSARA